MKHKVLRTALMGAACLGVVACASGNQTRAQRDHEVACLAGTVAGGVLGAAAGTLIGAGTGQLIAVGAGSAIGAFGGRRLLCGE